MVCLLSHMRVTARVCAETAPSCLVLGTFALARFPHDLAML